MITTLAGSRLNGVKNLMGGVKATFSRTFEYYGGRLSFNYDPFVLSFNFNLLMRSG